MNKRSKTTAFQGEDESYRILVETMNEGAVTLLPEGTVTYCNPRFSEMVGMSPDKVIGRLFSGFSPRSSNPYSLCTLNEAGTAAARRSSRLWPGTEARCQRNFPYDRSFLSADFAW